MAALLLPNRVFFRHWLVMKSFFKKSSVPDQQSFASFYDAYAPKLWGLILRADLTASQSETILINTLTKGWQELGPDRLTEKYSLSKLLNLAYREGLPTERLQTILKPNQR